MKTRNFFSVDLESASQRQFDLSHRRPIDLKQTEALVNQLLDLLTVHRTSITFFVVAELYEQLPELIDKINKQGHEIGYHTHRHVILKTKADLLTELKLSRKFLNKFHPVGFRAPKMYFKKEFFPILKDNGFKYDSSTYDSFNQTREHSGIKEIPVSCWSWLPGLKLPFPMNFSRSLIKGIPFGSGLLVGLLGRRTQYLIDLVNRNHQPVVLFIHPWQLETSFLKETLPGIKNFHRHWLYDRNIFSTLEQLFSKNKFVPLREGL